MSLISRDGLTSGKTIVRNSALILFAQIVPLFVSLVTVPLILKGWGLPRYGLLSLVWVVLGYCTIDLGLGRATTKYVAEALGDNEQYRIPQLVWTSVLIVAVLGCLSGVVLTLLVPALTTRVLNIPPELMGEAKSTFFILAPAIPLVLVFSIFAGILEAAQRFDLSNFVRIPLNISTNLLTLLGVILGFGLPNIVAMHLIARSIGLVILIFLALRILPELRELRVSKLELKLLLPYGAWMTVLNILGPLLSYAERFILGMNQTMTLVGYYTVPIDLILKLWIIPTSILTALFPAFSLLGIKRHAEVRILFLRSVKFLILIAAPLFLVIFCFANQALTLWLGSTFAQHSTPVLRILLIGAFLGLLAPLCNTLLQGLGRADILPKIYFAYFLPYLFISWTLISTQGIVGAAMAATLRSLVDTLVLLYLCLKALDMPVKSLREAKLGACLGILCVLGAFFLASSSLFSSPIGRIASAVLGMGLAGFLAWRKALDDMERALVIHVLERAPFFGAAALSFLRAAKHGVEAALLLADKPRVAWMQTSLLQKTCAPEAKKLIVIFTPGQDWVTGGILSISSIFEETLKLKGLHRAEVVRCTVPGDPRLLKYTQFADPNYLFTLSQVLSHFRHVENILFHIPEYAVGAFPDKCSEWERTRLRAVPSLHLNVLIQNIRHFQRVPPVNLRQLSQLGKVTGTTAHAAYFKMAEEKLGAPVHWLSVYVSPEQYRKKTFLEKENRIIISPDAHPMKEEILQMLARACPELEQQIVRGLNYRTYKDVIARSKWSLTFGEGLDGYFVEPVFSGAVAFAVYNAEFFTEEFKHLRTVYADYETLRRRIREDIQYLDQGERFAAYQDQEYRICSARYSERDYLNNLKSFYATYYSNHISVP